MRSTECHFSFFSVMLLRFVPCGRLNLMTCVFLVTFHCTCEEALYFHIEFVLCIYTTLFHQNGSKKEKRKKNLTK